MAHSISTWDLAKGYYEAGLSLSQIKTKTNIARNTISQRAKKEQWEHGRNVDYIKAKEIIAIKKGTETEQSIICADDVSSTQLRRANLVYGASESLLKITQDLITSNNTVEKMNMGDGKQTLQDRELNTTDLKNIADTIDKTSVTLGVNQRHANSQVTVNNTNAQQNNDNNSNLIAEALKAKYANK